MPEDEHNNRRGNYLFATLLLPAIIIAGLFGLGYLPDIEVFGGWQLRKVDILADVKLSKEENDSIATIIEAQRQEDRRRQFANDSIFPGVVPIVDFSKKEPVSMMDRFYSKLDTLKRLNRPVRIAYYGDSFIGCDILTSNLRELFQSAYGGRGVGAIDAVMPDSRITLIHNTKGLTFHAVTKPKTFKKEHQGMLASYAVCDGSGSIRMSGTRAHTAHVDAWGKTILYFRPTDSTTVSCRINGKAAETLYEGMSDELTRVETSGSIRSVEWTMQGAGGEYYLVANEDSTGVCVDNFSLVSSPGTHLRNIPKKTLKEFAALREYDLIIFQYGLNVANPRPGASYKHFQDAFKAAIANFRAAWPDAAIMMVSVSDRCKGNDNGTPKAMPGIEELVIAQRQIAKDNGVAFWNLYEAMGGKASIAQMQQRKQANKDFTHINHRGGKFIAEKFYKAFENGMFNYKRRYE